MRINHRPFAHVRAHVHKHRRHTNYPAAHVRSIANARAAGHNAHSIRQRETFYRISRLVEKRLLRRIDGHVGNRAHAKPEKDALLHPGVHAPAGFCGRIRLCSANFPAVERRLEIPEKTVMFLFVMLRSFIE